jgi:hypothetical protein
MMVHLPEIKDSFALRPLHLPFPSHTPPHTPIVDVESSTNAA